MNRLKKKLERKNQELQTINTLINNLYYAFINKIENIDEEDFDIDGIINIFINCFDDNITSQLFDRSIKK